jgi:uncharacterized protein YbjT (DUF2867 family)
VLGDLEDRASLERAASNVDAIFAMSTPFEKGMDVETRQGINLADTAKARGVKHLVYTSVASADRNTGIPHFDSKYKVEQHIKKIGVPFTIIGPVFFRENFLSPWWLPGLQQGQLSMALPASRKLQQIELAEIARFAALALEKRDSFLGNRIDIASDEVSGAEVAAILSRVSGKKIEYVELPIEQLRAANEDFAKMFDWFNREGYSIDIAALRRNYPEVGWRNFQAWAEAQDWRLLKASAASAEK